jgi:8-oxo-dGTP pyrophosphatase MutT (NUDIX family)
VTPPSRNPAPSPDELLRKLPVERPPIGSAGAAVTIVLRQGREDVEVLLIERSTQPDDPASGQVALPGGHVAEGDGNLADTALRELEEEVGLGPQDLEGDLRYVSTEFARRFGLAVGVFAAALGPGERTPTVRSQVEVAHVFWLPRASLSVVQRVTRDTPRGPFEFPATIRDGHVVWGFTRRVLRQFFGFPSEGDPHGPLFAPDPPFPP